MKLHNLKDIKCEEIEFIEKYIKDYIENSSLIFSFPDKAGILPIYNRTLNIINEEYYAHCIKNYNLDHSLNKEDINKLLEIWCFLSCDYENGTTFGIDEKENTSVVLGVTGQNNILLVDAPQNIPYELMIRYAYPYMKDKNSLSESEKEELKRYSHALRHYEHYMTERGVSLDNNNIYKNMFDHLFLLPEMENQKLNFIKRKYNEKDIGVFINKRFPFFRQKSII